MGYKYNQAIVMGRLTKDPKTSDISETNKKTTFVIAVDRNYKNEAGEIEADFIPVSFFGSKAAIAQQILKKGSPILIWGSIRVSKYEKEKDIKWMTEISGDNFQILEKISSPEPSPKL
jgi:single-strand DNA-binding protein